MKIKVVRKKKVPLFLASVKVIAYKFVSINDDWEILATYKNHTNQMYSMYMLKISVNK